MLFLAFIPVWPIGEICKLWVKVLNLSHISSSCTGSMCFAVKMSTQYVEGHFLLILCKKVIGYIEVSWSLYSGFASLERLRLIKYIFILKKKVEKST